MFTDVSVIILLIGSIHFILFPPTQLYEEDIFIPPSKMSLRLRKMDNLLGQVLEPGPGSPTQGCLSWKAVGLSVWCP